MNVFIKTVVIAGVLLAGAMTFAKAEELIVPEPYVKTVYGGQFCTTARSVEIAVTRFSMKMQGRPMNCFDLKQTVKNGGISPKYWYETNRFYFLITQFYANDGSSAWGVSEVRAKEKPEPKPKGEPL